MAGFTRDQKRYAATRRAQFNLDVAYDRIDFAESVAEELKQIGAMTKKAVSAGSNEADVNEALPIQKAFDFDDYADLSEPMA